MTVRTSAGTTISVSSATPATFNAAGYAALTWTPIGEVTDLGEFGRNYASVTHNPLGSRSTVKKKGSFNAGAITVAMGLDNDDAGQVILNAAALSDADYSFKVLLQNGDIYYFQGQVMSFVTGVGGVDQITTATAMIELTSTPAGVDIILVNAA